MLAKFNGVAIVVAHRLTTICNCDKIVVMDDGRAVEQGTHDQLLRVDKPTWRARRCTRSWWDSWASWRRQSAATW